MKILLIAHWLPWPLEQNGGAQRTGHFLQALRRWGSVDVVVAQEGPYLERMNFSRAWSSESATSLRKLELPPGQIAKPWSWVRVFVWGKLRTLCEELGKFKAELCGRDAAVRALKEIIQSTEYDLVVVRQLPWAMQTGAARIRDIPVLLDLDDIDWEVYRAREIQSLNRGIAKRLRNEVVRFYLEHNARKCLRAFHHVWAASEEDQEKLAIPHCTVLPNVPILPDGRESSRSNSDASRQSILFVGTFMYTPNVHGVEHFLNCVWPTVHKAHPEVLLRIVGKLPEDTTRVTPWMTLPSVEVLGFVESIDEVYAQALFTIAPIYWGGGTKIKVLESLGRGRTCVATAHALYGVDRHIRNGDCVLQANSDEEFAENCVTLLEKPAMRERLEQRGKEVIRDHFSTARFNQAVDEVIRAIAEKTSVK